MENQTKLEAGNSVRIGSESRVWKLVKLGDYNVATVEDPITGERIYPLTASLVKVDVPPTVVRPEIDELLVVKALGVVVKVTGYIRDGLTYRIAARSENGQKYELPLTDQYFIRLGIKHQPEPEPQPEPAPSDEPKVGMGVTLILPDDKYPYIITAVKVVRGVTLLDIEELKGPGLDTGDKPEGTCNGFPVWAKTYSAEDLADPKYRLSFTARKTTLRKNKRGQWVSGERLPFVVGVAKYRRNYAD